LRRFVQYWLPPIAWMAVIWSFSTDVASAEHTAGPIAWIVSVLFPSATPAQVQLIHAFARKLGHLTEYAILAALWFRAVHAGRRLDAVPSALTALAVSAAWAILDEFHQSFVPSRTSSALDVLIDVAGAGLALLLIDWRRRVAAAP
jgi:VanZ family protein